MNEECIYSDPVVEAVPGEILDARHCQEFCQEVGPAYGANHWVFDLNMGGKSQCTLHNKFDVKTCNVRQGPQMPTLSTCGF